MAQLTLGTTSPQAADRLLVARKLRRLTVIIAGVALVAGAAAMRVAPLGGLVATAIILGWTQLVGL